LGELIMPGLEIEKVETKLHCVFVEQPVALPVTIPYLNVRTERLGTVTLAKDIKQKINFEDIDMRRQWKWLMIYCKMRPRQYDANDAVPEFPETDKSAAIMSVKLSTDIQHECVVATSRERINSMTLRNYPEYIAPIRKTGGVLGLVFNEFNQRKEVTEGYNHIHGEVVVEQDWSEKEIEVDVYLSFLRTDVMLELTEEFVKSNIHLK